MISDEFYLTIYKNKEKSKNEERLKQRYTNYFNYVLKEQQESQTDKIKRLEREIKELKKENEYLMKKIYEER